MLLVGMLQHRMFGKQTCYFLHQHKFDRDELNRFFILCFIFMSLLSSVFGVNFNQ